MNNSSTVEGSKVAPGNVTDRGAKPISLSDSLLQLAHAQVRQLPESIEGEGGRCKLWRAARTVCELGLEAEIGFEILEKEFNPRCKPPWSERELWLALRDAYAIGEVRTASEPSFPVLDPTLRDSVCKSIVTEEELSSLAPPPTEERDPDFYLESLFGEGNPLLCLAKTMSVAETKRRKDWLENLDGIQFIVPSPMSARTGFCKNSEREGPRTLDNTGPRKYLVVEFDLVEKDKEGKDTKDALFIRSMMELGCSIRDISATLLAHLATRGPLVMVVSSGGKSLHGWFRVGDKADCQIRPFFEYACRLGADRRLWTACQLVRLPDGIRDNGAPQNVIFFNGGLR